MSAGKRLVSPRRRVGRRERGERPRPEARADRRPAQGPLLRSEVNSELNFCLNFEGLVLGCIDADFCK